MWSVFRMLHAAWYSFKLYHSSDLQYQAHSLQVPTQTSSDIAPWYLYLWDQTFQIEENWDQSRTHCLILSSKQHFFVVLLLTSQQEQVIFTKCTLLYQYWGANAWGKEPACHQTTRRQAFLVWGLLGDAATLLPSPQSPVICDSGVISTGKETQGGQFQMDKDAER